MKIILSYQPQQLPPPFAYAAVLSVDTSDMSTDLKLEYLDRDTVSDDELRAEGFTRNDDFHWTGRLNQKWKEDIVELTELDMDADPNTDIYAHVDLDGNSLGFPKDITQAELIFQEVLQATLEQEKIEMPLEASCYIDDERLALRWKFSQRVIEVNGKVSENWEVGRKVIKTIYSLDFDTTKHSKKPNNASVNIGDGVWYHLPQTAISELESLIKHF